MKKIIIFLVLALGAYTYGAHADSMSDVTEIAAICSAVPFVLSQITPGDAGDDLVELSMWWRNFLAFWVEDDAAADRLIKTQISIVLAKATNDSLSLEDAKTAIEVCQATKEDLKNAIS